MPLYGWTCHACGWTLEQFQPLDERANAPDCPFCARLNYVEPMRREFSAPAIHGETVSKP